MNPVHVAAIKGHAEMLIKLLQWDPFPAMEKEQRGQTVLHLCVKHRQLETLEVLVEQLGELASEKDENGETPLHLAIRSKQLEMILFLVRSNQIKRLTRNSMDKTERDILHEIQSSPDITTNTEIITKLGSLSIRSLLLEQLPNMSDITKVVVVLIASMAFQAAISPPGGVWRDDTSSHRAGKAVMASTHPKLYKHFVIANATAFVSSLVTIFLVTTGMTQALSFFLVFATLAMWVSMASIIVCYGASLTMTNPMGTLSIGPLAAIVVSVFFSFFLLLAVYDFIDKLRLSSNRKERKKIYRRDSRERLNRCERFYLRLFGRSGSPSQDIAGTIEAA